MGNEKVEQKLVFSFEELDTKTVADLGYEVEITKADGEPTGMFIKVLGTDSNVYQKLREKFDRARIKMMAKSGRNAVDSLYDSAKNHDLEMVAACTVSWRHEKMEMPFSADDKDQLVDFYNKYPLVYDQVRVAMNDRTNFIKESVKH